MVSFLFLFSFYQPDQRSKNIVETWFLLYDSNDRIGQYFLDYIKATFYQEFHLLLPMLCVMSSIGFRFGL